MTLSGRVYIGYKSPRTSVNLDGDSTDEQPKRVLEKEEKIILVGREDVVVGRILGVSQNYGPGWTVSLLPIKSKVVTLL